MVYDYLNQAWTENGKYVRCGHPEAMQCDCFGRLHENKPASECPACHNIFDSELELEAHYASAHAA